MHAAASDVRQWRQDVAAKRWSVPRSRRACSWRVQCCGSTQRSGTQHRVRRATWADVQSVARLCAAAFVELPGSVPQAPSVEGWSEYLDAKFFEANAREATQAVGVAMSRKEEAAAACRATRRARRAAALQAAVAAVTRRAQAGEPVSPDDVDAAAAALEATWPPAPPLEEARLRRARQWMCLVTDDGNQRVTGWCASI